MPQTDVIVTGLSRKSCNGWLRFGHLIWPCALGRTGRSHFKREGDGATPIGRWPIRRVLFRPDRRQPMAHPPMREIQALRRNDDWCDACGDPNYNRPVRHPYAASAERLWRADQLYDVIIVLGHNDRPRVQGGGSAIFMHVAAPRDDGSLEPTAGCLALRARDLRVLLTKIGSHRYVRILD